MNRPAHPLVRLVDPVGGADPTAVMAMARAHPERYMTPWQEPPQSVATGILDNVTYDSLGVIEAMARTGGSPVLATEEDFARAHELEPNSDEDEVALPTEGEDSSV